MHRAIVSDSKLRAPETIKFKLELRGITGIPRYKVFAVRYSGTIAAYRYTGKLGCFRKQWKKMPTALNGNKRSNHGETV